MYRSKIWNAPLLVYVKLPFVPEEVIKEIVQKSFSFQHTEVDQSFKNWWRSFEFKHLFRFKIDSM